jgi:putative endonuclease
MNSVKPQIHYVHILLSHKNGKFYTGCTNDLQARFNQHENGEVSSTKNRGPFEMIYYEASTNKLDAYSRERYLKIGIGKRYLKNRIKCALDLAG